MRKLEASAVSRATFQSLEQLELTFIDGTSVVLGAMKDRDEAFNTIIGFSALQWQVSKTAFMCFGGIIRRSILTYDLVLAI